MPDIYLPAMPNYLPFHLELIYLTGIIEIFFGVGIILRSVYKITSILTAIYFLAILPAHIHVSLNGIEMFGVSSQTLLWLRTIFQFVLIHWALKCGGTNILGDKN